MNQNARSNWPARVVIGLILGYTALIFALTWIYPYRYQITFEAYYFAAKAYETSDDPYNAELIRDLADKRFVYPFNYLPATVHVFRPFTLFDYATAARIYLLLKLAAIVFLVWLWHAKFLKRGIDPMFLAVCFFGFNFALYWDVWTGNVNLLTHVVLWIGLYAFTLARYRAFGVCVALAAFYKLTPMFFLGLLLFAPGKARWQGLAIGGVLFAALAGASPLFHADLMDGFRETVVQMRGIERDVDPEEPVNQPGSASTYMFYKEAMRLVENSIDRSAPDAAAYTLFALTAAAVVLLTLAATRRYWPARTPDDRIVLVLLACLVYLLILPRVLVYTYIIGLLPAYAIARRYPRVDAGYVLLALMLVSPIVGRPAGINLFIDNFSGFYPLFLAYAVWAAGLWAFYKFPQCDELDAT